MDGRVGGWNECPYEMRASAFFILFYVMLRQAMACHMLTGAPNIVKIKTSKKCIKIQNLVRIDWKMMPQWSKTCIFGPFLCFLCHAAPCYITTGAPNSVRDKMSTYTASINQVW
jgi:hypothetical protein